MRQPPPLHTESNMRQNSISAPEDCQLTRHSDTDTLRPLLNLSKAVDVSSRPACASFRPARMWVGLQQPVDDPYTIILVCSKELFLSKLRSTI